MIRLETIPARSHNLSAMLDPLDDTPSLPKLPFIVADGALVLTAAFIAWQAPAPLSPSALVAIVTCVIVGALLLAVPFVVDYARRENRLLNERQDALTHLATIAANAAEQASIAANGLQDLARQSAELLNEARALPDRWQDITVAPSTTPAPAVPPELAQQLTALRKAVDTLAARPAAPASASSPTLPPDLLALPTTVAALAAQIEQLRHSRESLPPPTAPKDPKPPRKLRSTDPAAPSLFPTADSPADVSDPAPLPPVESAAPAEPVAVPPPKPKVASPRPSVAAGTPAAPTADAAGTISLTVTAYIGIGNKLFVRGTGAGLAADEGQPLHFVSIGKWRWETDSAQSPVTLTLWKNDEVLCTSVGELVLAPGETREVTANF